jgi:hypothetical protein
MNFTRAISLVMSKMGNIPSMKTKAEDMMEYVKEFMCERDSEMRFWFLMDRRTYLVPAGELTITLENDFLAERYRAFIRPVDTTRWYDKLMAFQQDAISDTLITSYYLEQYTLSLTPPLPVDTTFEVFGYWATAPLKESVDTNPWLLYAGDLLVALTTAQLLNDMQDQKAAIVQEANAQRAKRRLAAETDERLAGVAI